MVVEQINSFELNSINTVIFIFVAVVGAMASSLVNNNGNIKSFGWKGGKEKGENGNPGEYCIGFISDIIIGVAAAFAILWTLTPQTFYQLIGVGTVAGFGGSSVLRALVNKLEGDHAKSEADIAKKEIAGVKQAETENTVMAVEAVNKKDEIIANIKEYLLQNNQKAIYEELVKNKLIE